jgi:hypothetical protein
MSKAVIPLCVETPAANDAAAFGAAVRRTHTHPPRQVATYYVPRMFRQVADSQEDVAFGIVEGCPTSAEPPRPQSPASACSLEFLAALAHAALFIVLGAILLRTYVWGS